MLRMGGSEHSRAFARALREERTTRGLSRRQLAAISGVSERALINYENAVNEPPLGQAAKLAASLGLTIDEMLAGSNRGKPAPTAGDARDLLEESIRLQQIALVSLDDE